ncbi:MAG: GatB/YqeY domain-containing protein, partial [Synergistales bacterium]|nr:GatB/YqeY domain-containing protein [Synergistales bacterium]
MSELFERIQADLVHAMKARESLKLSTLRMLKAEIQKAEVAESRADSPVSDEEVISLVQRLIKQRNEAAEQFSGGGAHERARQEMEEVAILEQYLPRQLSEEELDSIIQEVCEDVMAVGIKDMGRVMGKVMPKVKGKAEGN